MQALSHMQGLAPVVAPQQETCMRKQQMGLGRQQNPRLPRVVPSAKPRQFRTIRENIDKKRIEKLAETNPEAVRLDDPKPAVTSSEGGPPVALLAGGAVVLLLAAALLAGQS